MNFNTEVLPTLSTLSIDITSNRELNKFTCSVFDYYVDKNNNKGKQSPKDWEASTFARRFVHSCKTISGSFFPKWETGITVLSNRLFNCWDGPREISPAAQKAIDTLQSLGSVSQETARIIAEKNDNYVDHLNLALGSHQKIAANCLQLRNHFGLWMEAGSGKTAPTIEKIYLTCEHINSTCNRPARILILGPKNIRDNWRQELRRFLPSQTLSTSQIAIVSGSESYRTELAISTLLCGKNATVICGYEGFVNTSILKPIAWDLVVLDESHNIADPSTNRTKNILELNKTSTSRIILTGTPFRNKPWDYWAQFEFLMPGVSGFGNITSMPRVGRPPPVRLRFAEQA